MSLPVAPYKVLWLGREYSLDPHDAYMLCSCAGKTCCLSRSFHRLSPPFAAVLLSAGDLKITTIVARCGTASARISAIGATEELGRWVVMMHAVGCCGCRARRPNWIVAMHMPLSIFPSGRADPMADPTG